MHAIDAKPEIDETFGPAPRRVLADAAGTGCVENSEISGMKHGIPVGPIHAREQASVYASQVGSSASRAIMDIRGLAHR